MAASVLNSPAYSALPAVLRGTLHVVAAIVVGHLLLLGSPTRRAWTGRWLCTLGLCVAIVAGAALAIDHVPALIQLR